MSLPAKYLTFYRLQREKAGQDMTPRQWFTEGFDAAMRHFYENETRQPDRRIPRECGCISGHCTQEPAWSAGVRCKARMQEGAELMEVNHG